jgi:pyruvate dehydrogenase E1 component beta subunit
MNNAASLLHMSGGQFNVPLVIRMTTGAGRQLAAQHSHSLEGWYAHIPGLRILAPATLEDARGMLPTALRDPDPVLIFEHGSLYNLEGELADDAGAVDIDRAAVRRPGSDLTIVAVSSGRTHRAVVVDEGWRTGSLAAEVSARITEDAFYDLDAPVARVCSAEVPMPYARHLEEAALPQVADIVAAAKELGG